MKKYEFKGKCENCGQLIETNKAEFKSGHRGSLFGYYRNCPFCKEETEILPIRDKVNEYTEQGD